MTTAAAAPVAALNIATGEVATRDRALDIHDLGQPLCPIRGGHSSRRGLVLLTRKALNSFNSVADLTATIDTWAQNYNANPQPFVSQSPPLTKTAG